MVACADTVRDIDGNLYQAVKVGNRIWTVTNYRCTKYNDGSPLNYVKAATIWPWTHVGACMAYGNNESKTEKDHFGLLYNWHAIMANNFAPQGWRVQTVNDWNELKNTLNSNSKTTKAICSRVYVPTVPDSDPRTYVNDPPTNNELGLNLPSSGNCQGGWWTHRNEFVYMHAANPKAPKDDSPLNEWCVDFYHNQTGIAGPWQNEAGPFMHACRLVRDAN
jgi:uncharacterized protein (TIGR02145 family)